MNIYGKSLIAIFLPQGKDGSRLSLGSDVMADALYLKALYLQESAHVIVVEAIAGEKERAN